MEGTKEGRSVSITETTTPDQTSPVSVLDASLYKEDDSPHSPQLIPSKRCILFHGRFPITCYTFMIRSVND